MRGFYIRTGVQFEPYDAQSNLPWLIPLQTWAVLIETPTPELERRFWNLICGLEIPDFGKVPSRSLAINYVRECVNSERRKIGSSVDPAGPAFESMDWPSTVCVMLRKKASAAFYIESTDRNDTDDLLAKCQRVPDSVFVEDFPIFDYLDVIRFG